MLRFLHLLIFGYFNKPCNHTYEIINKEQMYEDDYDELGIGHRYTNRCTKCGSMMTYADYSN